VRRFPSFSAIVEWENARLAGNARAIRTLRELCRQIRELTDEVDERPELIILYEKGVVKPATIETALSSASAGDAPVDVRLHATEGSNYYGQKNEGAELASREYLLFLDSDVVPEEGWLRALLGSLQAGVDVVAGSTYVEPDSFIGRAFGLFWFFPLRSPARGLIETRFFFANNVIFRRELFLDYKFPDLPLYRGHCTALGNRLLRQGVRLYQQTNARVAHPPPNGTHFIHRALSEGHDVAMRARLQGRECDLGMEELRRQLQGVQKRINNRLKNVEVRRSERAAAIMLGKVYCVVRFAGQLWAARSPENARRALGIRTFGLPSPAEGTSAFSLPLREN
jgi:glycosyltransferase involved in cell wall biosynthesis